MPVVFYNQLPTIQLLYQQPLDIKQTGYQIEHLHNEYSYQLIRLQRQPKGLTNITTFYILMS